MTAGLASNLWLSLLRSGLAANRPTTPDSVGMCFYLATDTSVLSMWNGTQWLTVGTGGTGTTITRNANVAAAGTDATNGGQLAAGFTVVTGANATKGVLLPATPVAGTVVIIKNEDSANAVLKVWPDTAATINAISSNADYPLAAKASLMLIADSPTQWYTLPLLGS